ncbi:MAG: ABC transporter permease subunit [Oscillospiraceae bacterium]|nr:ABC transporter permease subunit [Oscillospiraceae bacterium]
MKKALITAAGILFWLIVWQIAAVAVNSRILLVSPVDVIVRLSELVVTADFWGSVLFSAARIMLGFFLGLATGTLLAVLSGKFRVVRVIFSPLISVMKSIPVASFTILALFWISSENLSVLVTFLICTPIVCSNMQAGIDSLDPKLEEMSKVFKIPAWRRFSGVYLSQLMPHFRSASALAIGLSWKSGAAAEVIGIPDGSIGEKLFMSKIYLETADLFAWTAAIILLSLLCEKLFLLLVGILQKKIERM